MTDTLRNALMDAYWGRPYTHGMAIAMMEVANARDEDYQAVSKIIDRHLAGRGPANFDMLVKELAEFLGYEEPEATKTQTLEETICRSLKAERTVDGRYGDEDDSQGTYNGGLAMAETIIRKHFAALTVEDVAEAVILDGTKWSE